MGRFLQMAPMQAMTDIHFMNTYHQFFGGFNEMMAPYLMATGNSPMKLQNLKKAFSKLNPEITLIPQLLSNDASGFLYYANNLFDLGYKKINWNLGCPNPYVMKKQRGAGLLPFPQKIDELLKAILPDLKPELSVKLRLGLYHQDEILPIVNVLNKYTISEVVVHPRTAVQNYEGKADFEYFARIYPKFKNLVIYNGDIIHKEQVYNIESKFKDIKGFMIGRGVFINPFITQQIRGVKIAAGDKLSLYRDFYFKLHNYYKENTGTEPGFLGHMKNLWAYFSQSFHKGESYLFALKTINEVSLFEDTVNKIFTTGKLKI